MIDEKYMNKFWDVKWNDGNFDLTKEEKQICIEEIHRLYKYVLIKDIEKNFELAKKEIGLLNKYLELRIEGAEDIDVYNFFVNIINNSNFSNIELVKNTEINFHI